MTDEIDDVAPAPGDPSRFHRKPPNPGYRVSGVPLRYVDQVQLSSVLRPAYRRLRTKADICDATAWTLHHWRRRAFQLARVGWGSLGAYGKKSRLPNALGCPVAFVLAYGKGAKTPCGMPTICPFCWAREVREYWLKIDAVFFPPVAKKKERVRIVDTSTTTPESSSFTHSVKDVEAGAKSPYDLVRRAFTFRLPAFMVWPVDNVAIIADGRGRELRNTVIQRPGITAFLDSRIHGEPDARLHRLPECRALLKAAGPGGGMLEVIQHRRIADRLYPWEVEVRQLILAADGHKVSRALHPLATSQPQYHIVITKPSRRVVVSAVARALVYPYDALLGPHTPLVDVVEYLNARRGRRLVATYGRFRRSKAPR